MHSVAACAVDVHGRELIAAGDVERPIFLRSSAKPFIAAAIVRSGAAERFGFEDREIAVMSASHAGERFHVEAVRSILSKIGLDESALQCGAHPPRYPAAAIALAARGETYSALHNNCSGKHAGILALSLVLDAPVDAYLELEHPAQQAILALCERAFGVQFDDTNLGVDGCGIPAISLPLRVAALGFARYATLEGLDAADAAALGRVRDAVVAWPAYIGGTDSFDSALIATTRGAVVAKGWRGRRACRCAAEPSGRPRVEGAGRREARCRSGYRRAAGSIGRARRAGGETSRSICAYRDRERRGPRRRSDHRQRGSPVWSRNVRTSP